MNWLSDNVNTLSLIGAGVILVLTIFVAAKYIRQMKTDTATGELAEENWDGIGEYKNELPPGWAYAFLGTMIWGVWYFFSGYPLNAYSQIGEWNEEVKAYNAKFESKWANADAETLSAMGEGIFLVQCAPCHGVAADGINGKAANLHERLSKEDIVHTVKNGATNFSSAYPAGMPPMMLTDDAQINAVADYLVKGMPAGHEGEAYFAVCAGCHGMDGKGMAGVGPNLVVFDEVTTSAILESGKKGLIGTMPSFKGRLTPVQEKAMSVYLSSLVGE